MIGRMLGVLKRAQLVHSRECFQDGVEADLPLPLAPSAGPKTDWGFFLDICHPEVFDPASAPEVRKDFIDCVRSLEFCPEVPVVLAERVEYEALGLVDHDKDDQLLEAFREFHEG
jgi:hypothetical protein